jgi:hypothetical protein
MVRGGRGSRRWFIPLLSKGGLRGQQKVAPGGKRVALKKPTIVFSLITLGQVSSNIKDDERSTLFLEGGEGEKGWPI